MDGIFKFNSWTLSSTVIYGNDAYKFHDKEKAMSESEIKLVKGAIIQWSREGFNPNGISM